jgi:hypothetical protein
VNGERFSLLIDLLEVFDDQGFTELRVVWSFDSIEAISYWFLRGNAHKICGTDIKGRLVVPDVTIKFDGRWVQCGHTFAQLELNVLLPTEVLRNRTDEDMGLDQDQVERSLDTRGKLVMTIQRGRYEKPARQFAPLLWDGCDPPDTEVSSKPVVEDNHVSHAVR